MPIRRSEIIALSISLAAVLVGLWVYPQLPERVASHWNITGQVDGSISKFWGAFLMPVVMLTIFLIFLIIPKIDPRRANIEKFRRYFDWFIIALFVFFFYVYCLTLAWNLGAHFNFTPFFLPALSTLFYFVGIMTEKTESNWTIGIRTPWTLSSETVWRKTHQLAGQLFKASAFISLLGLLAGQYAFWFLIGPIFISAAYSIIYSYFAFRKEKNAKI